MSESEPAGAETSEEAPYEVPRTERIKVRELYFGNLNVGSVNYTWTEHEIGSDWEPWEAVACDECGHVSGDPSEDQCPKGHDLPERGGPMMSYYYPIQGFSGDPKDAAMRIVDLPVCLVRIGGPTEEDVWALALTGGGMDLRWEICEAFMRLGYLPPVQFADLPAVSGRGTSKRDRAIIAACRRSFEGAKAQAENGLRGLREMAKRAASRSG